MSAVRTPGLRTLAFGAASGGIWGLVVEAPDAVALLGSLAGEAAGEAVPVSVAGAGPDGETQVTGEGIALRAVPAEGTPEVGEDGWTGLCRVEGELTVGGRSRTVACDGIRAEIGGVELARLGSLRQVLAWFGGGDAVALAAVRPPKASGQEADAVRAVLFEPEGPVLAHDPRLSTTYAGEAPARMGLELWLPAENDGEYPVRVAGEALGGVVSAALPACRVEGLAMLAHHRGRDGLATYLLARPR